MADSDPDSESSSPLEASPAAISALLRDIAGVSPVPGALRGVVLPTPLRGLQEEAPRAHEQVPRPGMVVGGRYRLDAVLGSGGMGVVFAAHHLQTGKPVALKWLALSRVARGSADRAHALARFAREVRAAGRIRHPNVVDVYDASGDAQAPYLVMERLEGETLRARIERVPLSWEELMRLLVPALQGVAELHRLGIIHRDLKPDNVFLARLPGVPEPCAKVLDFGVSLLLSAEDTNEDSLTGTGAVVGTPSYMALEQLSHSNQVDERTDVYALGVVLLEALTGRRPWQARSAAEYGALLASTRPTRLSSLRPELAGPREAAIMKALQREPGDRHASVEALIQALTEASRAPGRARTWVALALLAAGTLLALGSARWTGTLAAKQLPSSATTARPPSVAVRREPAHGIGAGERDAIAPAQVSAAPVAPQPVAPVGASDHRKAASAARASPAPRSGDAGPTRRKPPPTSRAALETPRPSGRAEKGHEDQAINLKRDEF